MRLERAERLEDLRHVWDELALGAGHPFGTWEWVEPWWRHYGGGRELFTFAVHTDDGRIAAILPLYLVRSGRFPVARFMGYADLHSPLCAAEDRALAAEAMLALLGRGADRCRLIVAEKLPAEQGWGELLGGRLLATNDDPALRIEGRSWEEFLADQTRHFRSGVRRQEKRLRADNGLEFRLTEDEGTLDADITTMFALHEARFGEESTGIFEGERGEMQRRMMHSAFERGWLRLWIAEIEGEPAAAYYGWRLGPREWFFQSGRDPRFHKLSVGAVLLAHVVRDACEAELEEFRFLAGGEEYKKRYANAEYLPETRALGTGLRAKAAAVALARIIRMPDNLRARVLG